MNHEMFCIICIWKTSRPLSFQSRVLLRKDRFLRGETTGLSSTSAAHSSKMVGAGSTPPVCWFPWLVLRRITGLQREQPLMCWWLPQSREDKHALKEEMWNMWKFEHYNGWAAWEWMAGVYIVEFYSGKENIHGFE